jgi:GntR family transcriptional regulator
MSGTLKKSSTLVPVATGGGHKKLPIYIQIKELLLREIGAGRWVKGERLPTEAELAKQLNVAVGTLRKALQALETAGVLERRQGSGTYIAKAKKGEAIYHFFRLEKKHNIDHSGVPTAMLISVENIPLCAEREAAVLAALGLTTADNCWRFRRVRYLDEEAVCVEEIFLPQSRARGVDITINAISESLYLFYRQQLGFWVANVSDRISVASLPDWGRSALGISEVEGSEITINRQASDYGFVERTAYDQFNDVCEFSWTWFDPEKAIYQARWN